MKASGVALVDPFRNQILFNNASRNPYYGFVFNRSFNNSVYNNTADANIGDDYQCGGGSGNLYTNPLNVNFGLTKNRCRWLIAVSPFISGPQCAGIFGPTLISFTRDLLYPIGSTCFSIINTANSSANTTTINCNGYAAYATKGGTFLNVVGAGNVKVSNCLLLNFTTGFMVSNAISVSVNNNTVVYAKNGIIFNNDRFSSIFKNLLQNVTAGIVGNNLYFGSIYNNTLYNNTMAISVQNSTSSSVYNNTAIKNAIGLLFSNTTESTIMNNLLENSTTAGFECLGSSVTTASKNLDNGQNVCSNNVGCQWATRSPSCSPT